MFFAATGNIFSWHRQHFLMQRAEVFFLLKMASVFLGCANSGAFFATIGDIFCWHHLTFLIQSVVHPSHDELH